MSNRSFEEKYFDDMINRVLLDIEEEQIKESEEMYRQYSKTPPMKSSFRHRRRMKKIIRKFENEHYGNRTVRSLRRILVTATVAIVIVGSLNIFANANLSRIFQWLGLYSAEYVDITLSKDYTQLLIRETASWEHGRVYVPGLIPDGYVFDRINVSRNMIELKYGSADANYLRYCLRPLGENTVVSSDNKESEIKMLKIDGHDAVYFTNDSVNMIKYNTTEYMFEFISDVLTEKELVKIAENTKSLESLVVN